MIPKEANEDENCLNGNFMCGVVEGFYGRPWSTEQRKKLFKRMNEMGMNTYLYAPKDDCKHRLYWRELYSVEEADHLTMLIDNAAEQNVDFVYAISPGIDITYSSTKDCTLLKKKLEQVSSFGCKKFALLFDDIEVDMCEADKAIFQSFAHAQVSVTNEVFQHLGQTNFLFCPTEYCATRAVPDVPTSEYLNTLGSKLLPGIDIMWTGPKVISKDITVQSINELAKVLKRPPVIWDNLHANDYDRKRLFLGPYIGRSPEVIPLLKGVLTNPNCEFEANYIAMHTLANWAKTDPQGYTSSHIPDGPLKAEIALEQELDSDLEPVLPTESSYQPKQALTRAINDWFDEILSESRPQVKKLAPLPSVDPIAPLPIVNTCIVPTLPIAVPNINVNINNLNELTNVERNDSYVQPAMSMIPLNSLVDSSSDTDDDDSVSVEPMDCAITPNSTPASTPASTSSHMPDVPPSKLDNLHIPVVCNKCDILDVMQVDADGLSRCSSCSQMQTDPVPTSTSKVNEDKATECSITSEDLSLLVDLFYLPFQHGSYGEELLNNVCWLKLNAHVMHDYVKTPGSTELQEAVQDWKEHANKVYTLLDNYAILLEHFCTIPNQALVYDLFPYLWDMKVILNVLKCFIDWLASVTHGHNSRLVNANGASCPNSCHVKLQTISLHG